MMKRIKDRIRVPRQRKTIAGLSIFLLMIGFSCSNQEEDPEPVDCSISGLEVTAEGKSDPSGCGLNDGTITAMGNGGKTPYQFALNNGAFSANSSFTGLSAGTHILRIKDSNNCEAQVNVTLTAPGTDLMASTTLVEDTECLTGNGSIQVNVTGGEEPIEYRFEDEAFTSVSTFSDLQAGTYSVSVRDNSGCTITLNVTVEQGTTGVSYAAEIRPIVETKCAISGCHNGDNAAIPNWNVFSNIQAKAALVKEFTQSGFMPQTGSLTPEEKALIACWVDDGALNN